jgi:hypothetical protein
MRSPLLALATCSLLLVSLASCSDATPGSSGNENTSMTAEALGRAVAAGGGEAKHDSTGSTPPPGNLQVIILDTNYDSTTGQITGPAIIDGIGFRTPAWYMDRPNTLHAAAPEHLYPPNPCDGLVHGWNNAVAQTNAGINVSHLFEVFLSHGAAHQCAFVLDASAPADNGSVALTLRPTGGQTLTGP